MFLVSFLFNEFPHGWIILVFAKKRLLEWWAGWPCVVDPCCSSSANNCSNQPLFCSCNNNFIILPKTLEKKIIPRFNLEKLLHFCSLLTDEKFVCSLEFRMKNPSLLKCYTFVPQCFTGNSHWKKLGNWLLNFPYQQDKLK